MSYLKNIQKQPRWGDTHINKGITISCENSRNRAGVRYKMRNVYYVWRIKTFWRKS